MSDLEQRMAGAVRFFWETRNRQKEKQGRASGKTDLGGRSAVTGGAQLKGFIQLVSDYLIANGIPDSGIYLKNRELPGYFRPTKDWDILVVMEGHLLAALEC